MFGEVSERICWFILYVCVWDKKETGQQKMNVGSNSGPLALTLSNASFENKINKNQPLEEKNLEKHLCESASLLGDCGFFDH